MQDMQLCCIFSKFSRGACPQTPLDAQISPPTLIVSPPTMPDLGEPCLELCCACFAESFFSGLLKLMNAQEFTLFRFCVGKFLKFQVQLFMQT